MSIRVETLGASGGFLLIRQIGQGPWFDACGAYPVLSCRDPSRIDEDIATLSDELVSVSLIPDPLLAWNLEALAGTFPIIRPMGEHYLIDLDLRDRQPSSHHRRSLRKASTFNTEIRIETNPIQLVTEWTDLYSVLIKQVGITGVRRFSKEVFSNMLALRGASMVSAWDGEALLGLDWYFEDEDRVYAHLAAYSPSGYARAVSYPMMDAALRHFAKRGARVMDLGGVPVVGGDDSGLAQFKRGWATRTEPAWLCGRVLNQSRYADLSASHQEAPDAYFPRYRWGEFG
jgi:hypothetical protein